MALAFLIDWPTGPDLRIGTKDSGEPVISREFKVRLGLDLKGGTQLVYRADLSNISSADYNTAMQGVRDVIERRVNAFGVSEPVVQTSQTSGEHRLIVELAGISDVQTAIDLIGQTPLLEFKEVKEGTGATSIDTSNIDTSDPEQVKKLLATSQPEYIATKLTGAQLKSAKVDFDQQTGQAVVALQFNDEGRKLFADITKRNIGKQVAILLDGNVISAPVVNQTITEGQAIITGDFSIDEAKTLATRLNSGALPVPISLVSQQTIGASLGKISVQKSVFAGFLGFIVIALFMIVYYRLPGILATIALVFYTILTLALYKFIPVTLTLAGIAGFILSIGMAVDANILIFERIKEEMRHGKSLADAIQQGFSHAWPSIRDSNVSTFITAVILSWFGTSIVKGFAVTLGLGVIVSMFSAIIVTKLLLQMISFTPLSRHPHLFAKIYKDKKNV